MWSGKKRLMPGDGGGAYTTGGGAYTGGGT